jgi:hypothetical protein
MQMPNGQMIVRSPARRPSARSALRRARPTLRDAIFIFESAI